MYCPDDPVTWAQMAVFLVRAFGLPLVGVIAGRSQFSPQNPKVAGSNPAPETIVG
jgi:hypothetical protein